METGLIPIDRWMGCIPLIDATLNALNKENIDEVTYEDIRRIIRLNSDKEYSGEYDLPPIIGEFTYLAVIRLTNKTGIKSIPEEIGMLSDRLTHLIIMGGKIRAEEIPNSLWDCRKLIYLNLCDNQLGFIPEGVVKLEKLQSLYLYNCSLSSIPSFIGKLQNLNSLYFGYNNVEEIPGEIFELPKLKLISAGGNNIKFLPEIEGGSESITYMDFDSNMITDVPANYEDLFYNAQINVRENYIAKDNSVFGRKWGNFISGANNQMQLLVRDATPVYVEIGDKINLEVVRERLGTRYYNNRSYMANWERKHHITSVNENAYRVVEPNVELELIELPKEYVNSDSLAIKQGSFTARARIAYTDEDNRLSVTENKINFVVTPKRDAAVNNVTESIALEEFAISNILKAEAAKIKKITSAVNSSKADVQDINASVTSMVNKLTILENILHSKLKLCEKSIQK